MIAGGSGCKEKYLYLRLPGGWAGSGRCRLTAVSGTSPILDFGFVIIRYILFVPEIFCCWDRAGSSSKIDLTAFCDVWRSEKGCRPVEPHRSPGHPLPEAGYFSPGKSSEFALYAVLWTSDC